MEMSKKEFIDLIVSTVEAKAKELGIGEVDAKHFAFDGKAKETKEEKKQSIADFLKSVIVNDTKALSGAVGSEGGFLIPTEFKREIIKGIEEKGIMRSRVTVMPVTYRSGTIPKVVGKPQFAIGAENSPFNEGTATFGELAYSLSRLDVFLPISRELLSDSAIDLENLIKNLFVEQYAYAEDVVMTVGMGTIVGFQTSTDIPSVAPAAADGTLTYQDLVNAFYALKEGYRSRAVIMASTGAMKTLRSLVDGNGQPLLSPPDAAGIRSIFGIPVIENDKMTNTLVDPDGVAGSGDEYYVTDIVIGDFKQSILFDRGEFAVESTKEGNAFLNHQIWIKSWNRIDYKIALPEAFVKLTGVKVV